MNKTLINPLNLLHEIIPVFTSVHCTRPVLNNKRSRMKGGSTFITRKWVNFHPNCCDNVWIILLFWIAAAARTPEDPVAAPSCPPSQPRLTAAPVKGRHAGALKKEEKEQTSPKIASSLGLFIPLPMTVVQKQNAFRARKRCEMSEVAAQRWGKRSPAPLTLTVSHSARTCYCQSARSSDTLPPQLAQVTPITVLSWGNATPPPPAPLHSPKALSHLKHQVILVCGYILRSQTILIVFIKAGWRLR